MKKALALVLALTMIMSLCMTGCGKKEESAPDPAPEAGQEAAPSGHTTLTDTIDPKNFSIGCSMITGTFYIFGSALADVINNKMDGYSATPEATDGSASNVQMVETGELLVGLTSTLTAYQGYQGVGFAEKAGTKYQNQRALFPTHSSYWQCITTPDTGIKVFSDFEGKNVDVTAPGGTPEVAFSEFFDALDVTPKTIVNSTFANSVDALKDNRIDNAVAVTGIPYSSIYDFASSNDMVLVDFTQEEVDTIVEKYPFYVPYTIPANTYPGQTKDVKSFEFWNVCIGAKNLDEEFVYNLLDAVYANTDVFKTAYANSRVEMEAIVNAGIPLHTGAVQWYLDHGVEIPANLIPEEYVA